MRSGNGKQRSSLAVHAPKSDALFGGEWEVKRARLASMGNGGTKFRYAPATHPLHNVPQ